MVGAAMTPCTSRPALLKAIRSPSSTATRQGWAQQQPRPCWRTSRARLVPALVQQQEQEVLASVDEADRAPPGCARYTVTLPKPLGLVLEEDRNGGIFVAEVVSGGNAERSGEVSVGDQLIATSGLTYTTQQKYQDNWVRGGEQIVRLNVRGEDFKTVMAAISSHPAHIQVVLEFQRCS